MPGREGIGRVQTVGARYALGVAAAAAGLGATHALTALLAGGPYFFFGFPAVLLAAFLAGTGPGLACAALYAIGASWLFVAPLGSMGVAESRAFTRLAVLTASASVGAVVGGRFRAVLVRERALRRDLEQEIAARATAEEQLRRTHGRLGGVQGLTAALSAARTSEEVAAAVMQLALPLVGARGGSICFQIEGNRLATHYTEHCAEDARRDFEVTPLEAPLPGSHAARTGRGIWLGSVAEIERRYPHLSEPRRRWGDRALACLPLRVEGEPLGVLSLFFAQEQTFDAVERAFIASVAQLCAQAFSRARRYETEQQARLHAEAAEEAARRAAALQDRVLAVVGHDLRTPLSAILISVALAQQRAQGHEGLATPLARIARSARRMHEIIRDLLDVARARQGIGMTLTRRPVAADEICAHAVAELEQIHPGRKIRLSSSGELRLEADHSRLLQAVSNLVGNALQHGAPEAEVSVHVSGERDAIVVRVRNAGSPIPASALGELFEPFRRGEGAPDGNGSLGLGLFIVREIARAHGGTVSASSDETGTTFELRLPRSAPEAAAGEAAPNGAQPH